MPAGHALPRDVAAALERARSRLGLMASTLHWLDSARSTNDVAARLAEDGAPEGTVVVAESQTEGRGRQGRTWFSPPGAGLYVSVILRPPPRALSPGGGRSAGPLTLACGVALARAVQAVTGLPAELKWPNDVLVGRRKLAGILAESSVQGDDVPCVVVGFGLNLRPAAYPADLAHRATSIEAETTRPADRANLFVETLVCLSEEYDRLCAGRFDAILAAWRALTPSLGRARVEWDTPKGTQRGRVEDIDDDGALLVRVGDTIERIVAGEVRWMT